MALKPRNSRHKSQIEAGITGRLKGHSFESELSVSLNGDKSNFRKPMVKREGHLYDGDPATVLASYILQHMGLEEVDKIKAYWLGGLATSGKGDTVFGISGDRIKRSKSDILIELEHRGSLARIGVSVKTCFKPKPTNAQLFCSTASAICGLFRKNNIPVSPDFESGLKMFCGDEGYRPLDLLGSKIKSRKSDPERWFFEELPNKSKNEITDTFTRYQDEITRVLLQRAYAEDPFPPQYILHQRSIAPRSDFVPLSIFHVDELIALSKAYGSFELRPYQVRKGRFKGDPNTHFAPRFGCVQFQRLGNKQNATQLQFNLEAGYFYKITSQR